MNDTLFERCTSVTLSQVMDQPFGALVRVLRVPWCSGQVLS